MDLYLNESGGGFKDYTPAAITPERALLESLAGDYVAPFDPLVTLEADADRLLWRTAGGEPKPIVFRADGSFDLGNAGRAGRYFRAQRDERGHVVGFEALANRVPAQTTLYRRIEPVSPTPAELAELTGDYRSPELDITYSLAVEDGRLTVRSLWSQQPIVFAPSTRDRFDSEHFSMTTIEIVRDTQSRPTGLRVHGGRIRHVLFERVPL